MQQIVDFFFSNGVVRILCFDLLIIGIFFLALKVFKVPLRYAKWQLIIISIGASLILWGIIYIFRLVWGSIGWWIFVIMAVAIAAFIYTKSSFTLSKKNLISWATAIVIMAVIASIVMIYHSHALSKNIDAQPVEPTHSAPSPVMPKTEYDSIPKDANEVPYTTLVYDQEYKLAPGEKSLPFCNEIGDNFTFNRRNTSQHIDVYNTKSRKIHLEKFPGKVSTKHVEFPNGIYRIQNLGTDTAVITVHKE